MKPRFIDVLCSTGPVGGTNNTPLSHFPSKSTDARVSVSYNTRSVNYNSRDSESGRVSGYVRLCDCAHARAGRVAQVK